MQLPTFKLPSLDTSFIQSVPQYIWERARYPFGKEFKLPRIEANFNFKFPGSDKKSVLHMKGDLKIKAVNVEKSINSGKGASYSR
ncbi:hypothetical protein HY468_05460 [Candidatus Roizmanbacteria bacterium]|nr:hypothetical protein [Candidatus Roizmanbacteria bacterium]